ncbi:MAG: hypothetical protein ABR591_06945 [Candidatus Velthaea sp.]
MKDDFESFVTYRMTTDPSDARSFASAAHGGVNAGVTLIFALAAAGGLCALLRAFVGH